jgi:hypothetical protein
MKEILQGVISLGEILLWIILAACGMAMLYYYGKSKKPFKNAAIGMATGGAGLLAAHFFGGYIGLGLALNFFNTAVSLILGIPGVALLMVSKFLLKT